MDETIHPSAPEDQHVPLRWRNPLPSVALVAESITVASLIERKQLFKVDPQQPARDAADRLGRFDFDAAPLDEDPVARYVERRVLAGKDGPACEFAVPINPPVLIAGPAPLATALDLVRRTPVLFVLEGHNVVGVITQADLQLAPVGLYTLGLVFAMENALDLLIKRHAGSTWRHLLTDGRLKKIDDVYASRKDKNAQIEQIDCLNLDDRERLARKLPAVRSALGFSSGEQVSKWMGPVKDLRNTLAHGGSLLDVERDPLRALELISDIRKRAGLVWDAVGPDQGFSDGYAGTITAKLDGETL
jgi:CBS domain-containing protein